MNEVWEQVMALKPKDKRHKGVANTLDINELETIIATIDFFGGSYKQDIFDLKIARYRVFDWLAMRIQGRRDTSQGDKDATKVLAHAFIKSEGDVDAFIDDLRSTDYDIDHSWSEIKLYDED